MRHPWKWYLEHARAEGLRVKPTRTHHAECVYPFFSYFLAKKYFPNDLVDKQCEDVFQKYFPQHYDLKKKELKVNYRIQDTAVWAGILADRFAVTGNEKDLEHASHLVDFSADEANDKVEHKWMTGVRGEEYLEQISDWNRSKKIWREKWGIDNFVHEVFKCMEEMALCNAYVVERADREYVGYNCNVNILNGKLTVTPIENTITRIHLNLRTPTAIDAVINGQSISHTFEGMTWIGPGGIPEDLRPFMREHSR